MSEGKLFFFLCDLGQDDNLLLLLLLVCAHSHSYQHTYHKNDYNLDWVIYSIFMQMKGKIKR